MSIGAVVFARMGSTRLPSKALQQIGERPLVGHVIDRANRVRRATCVVLATSTDATDEPLVAFAQSEGVVHFRGSLENVTSRAYECAKAQGLTWFARICGDRPFFDPADIDRAISLALRSTTPAIDLVTNAMNSVVAPGLTVEIVRTAALQKVLAMTSEDRHLEHVTRYMYERPDEFHVCWLSSPPAGTRNLRFVVDTPRDLHRARYIVARLAGPPATADIVEIATLAREWEERNREVADV